MFGYWAGLHEFTRNELGASPLPQHGLSREVYNALDQLRGRGDYSLHCLDARTQVILARGTNLGFTARVRNAREAAELLRVAEIDENIAQQR